MKAYAPTTRTSLVYLGIARTALEHWLCLYTVYMFALPNTYDERNLFVVEMGYGSYAEYLRSKLWARIRAKKLTKDPYCALCWRKAAQVHHDRYTRANLKGETLKGLYSLCYGCHKRVEFNDRGQKRTLHGAQMQLQNMERLRGVKGRKDNAI